jgi:hypothetical protein
MVKAYPETNPAGTVIAVSQTMLPKNTSAKGGVGKAITEVSIPGGPVRHDRSDLY